MDITTFAALRRRHLSNKQCGVLMIGAVIAYGVQVFLTKKCPDVSPNTVKIVTTVIMAVTAVIMLAIAG